MTTVLIACDKFKGSATSAQIAHALESGMRRTWEAHRTASDLHIRTVPVADGGDGTVEAALGTDFTSRTATVTGPHGEQVTAEYAYRASDQTAVLEVASACGLGLMPEVTERGGRTATTRGVGQLVADALDQGAHRIVLGLGGSATTDAGAGMLQALGARLLRTDGSDVGPGGEGLLELASVDLSGLDPRVGQVTVTAASDVQNPLCGPVGAAAVYGPQKGLGDRGVVDLDAGLARASAMIEQALGAPAGHHAEVHGAGAAGGLGFAVLAGLGGTLEPGVDVVLEMVGFQDALRDVDLVVTGEGKLDAQTLHGKAPAGVADRARAAGIPLVAVCGVSELSEGQAREAGIRAVYQLVDVQPDVTTCIAEPLPVLEELGATIMSNWL